MSGALKFPEKITLSGGPQDGLVVRMSDPPGRYVEACGARYAYTHETREGVLWITGATFAGYEPWKLGK